MSTRAGEILSRQASLGGRLRPEPRTIIEDGESPAPSPETPAGASPPATSAPPASAPPASAALAAAGAATASLEAPVAVAAGPAGPAESWSHRERARLEERRAGLPHTSWGRRGYDEAAVDELIAGVTQDLDEADRQIDDLRSEVDRLHRYIRRQWAAVAAAEAAGKPRGRHAVDQPDEPDPSAIRANSHGRGSAGPEGASPTVQARAVLTQAQEIAERRMAQAEARVAEAERIATARLAQAEREAEAAARATLEEAESLAADRIAAADEAAGHRLARTERIAEQFLGEAVEESKTRRTRAVDDARRLLVLARARYEDIIVRANQRADHAAELALDDLEPIDGEAEQADRELHELEAKAAYLRTFAKVSRTALQTALDLSGREFDQLLGDTATLEESLETQDRTALPEETPDEARPDAKVIVLPREKKSTQSRPAALSAK